jgi:sulfatase maturation enzyme AslB (radical SAM superfamily)
MMLLHVNIEPTNACQLHCRYCGDRKTRKIGVMSIENYRKILDMIPHPTEIRLFVSGEPLLNTELPFMISEALSRNHMVLVHTNGLWLRYYYRELVLAAMNYPKRLTISVSAHKRTTSLLIGIKKLMEYNNTYGKPITIVLQSIVPYPDKLEPFKYLQEFKDVEFTTQWPHNWTFKNLSDAEKQTWKVPCGFVQDSVAIYWNGDVPVCCADLNGDKIIGNLYKDGWDSIIRRIDEVAERQRLGIAEICNGCERYENADNKPSRR